MRTVFMLAIVTLAAILGIAQETRISRKDLPQAVQKTVEKESKGAAIVGFSKEVETGKTFYEMETKVNGRTRTLLMDPGGTVVELEQEVSLDEVPAAVKAAVEKSGGKLLMLESVTKGGTTTYEAHLRKAGKTSELKVKADGSLTKD